MTCETCYGIGEVPEDDCFVECSDCKGWGGPAPTIESDDGLIPVFVYGTLRVGHGNYSWSSEAAVAYEKDCTAEGQIFFVHGRSGYPVAKFDAPGKIVGDLIWYRQDHPDYQSVVRMELGAGYEMRQIVVRTSDGETTEAFGFHYRSTPRGERIESGDWAAAAYHPSERRSAER